jgi:HEAT repeat protein
LGDAHHGEAHAAELGAALERLYRDFRPEPVIAFFRAVAPQLDPTEAGKVEAPLHADLELFNAWDKRLDELASERLVNELVEQVKANEMPKAQESAKALISSAQEPAHRVQRARQIGVVLGGLIHEKGRAQDLIRTISRHPHAYGIDAMAATDLEEEYQKSAVAAVKRERPGAALSRVELTQAIVELGRTLPNRMAIHNPKPEDGANFERALRAIIASCLLSHGNNKYHEATLLLAEFSPKEVSAAGAMAGVEQRLHGALGRTARLVASGTLATFGAHKRVFDTYFEFAKRNIGGKIGRAVAEVLGLLGNPHADGFLTASMNDRKLNVRGEAMLALGAIGDAHAQKTLLKAFESAVGVRVLEGEQRRDAITALSALGRAAGRMDATGRSNIAGHVIKALPKDDTEMAVRAALTFLRGKPDGMNPKVIDWAAAVGTASLWNIDRPELARQGAAAPLGFRQPLIDLLERLAPHALPTINRTALEQAKTWCGAYLAMGELYAKVADPSALPVLRQLLMNTFLHDTSQPKSVYTKELILDPSTDERTELTRDKVLASLVYAVNKTGGEEAEEILSGMFEQIRSGRLKQPGKETADLLMQAHMASAKRRGVSAFAKPSAVEAEPESGGAAPGAISEEDVRFLHDLEAHYLLPARRRAKKVAAMAGLAQHKVVAALPALITHLADKDPIISAAAMTALGEFGTGAVSATALGKLHVELLETMRTGDNQVRLKIGDVLVQLGPKRSPLKERLEEFSNSPGLDLPTKSILMRVTGGTPQAAKPAPQSAAAAAAAAPDGEAEAEPSPVDQFMPNKGGGPVSALDKKRAYMLARQEWIKSGKRGSEPKPPE